jgi:ribonuclease VapC
LILDSSPVVAALFREQGYRRFEQAMEDADTLAIGAPTLLEVNMVVVGASGRRGGLLVARFMDERGIMRIPFADRHASVASEAFVRFGKGRHPAALNLGDCLTYATARIADEPLLFVGDDFARTDLTPALA